MKTLSLRLSFAAICCASLLPACAPPTAKTAAGGADAPQGGDQGGQPGSGAPTNGDPGTGTSAGPSGAPEVDPCAPGIKTGSLTGDASFSSPGGTSIIVRTPAGYAPQIPSPLIVVYAAAGKTADDMESKTALTAPATARGYIIAYVDHLSPSGAAYVQEAADSAKAVQDAWCVDPRRIFLTGHSDGGSMTHLVTLQQLLEPAAIAPSASGLSASSLDGVSCSPRRTPLLELHSRDDSLFPIADGFGASVAAWFAACSSCATAPSAPDADGCVVYAACMSGAEVRYCEGSGKHGTWPTVRNTAVLDFFDRFHL